jgi:hypothetical protein
MPNVDVGSYYMNKKFIHAKNKGQYIFNWHPFIMDLLQCVVSFNHKHKYVQFTPIYHIFLHKHPMIDFVSFKVFYQMFMENTNFILQTRALQKLYMVFLMNLDIFTMVKQVNPWVNRDQML